MENVNETPQGENENIEQPQGTTEAQATGSLDVVEPESTEEKPSVSLEELEAQLEQERKERQKIEMERNQLKNKQEEERKARLEEEGKYKELAEEAQAELERLRAEKQQEEDIAAANKLRDSIISEYPNEAVKKVAKAMIEENPYNLVWGQVETEEQAKAELNKQLDKIGQALGQEQGAEPVEEEQPFVHPNNPASDGGELTIDKMRNMSADELKKILPRADARQ